MIAKKRKLTARVPSRAAHGSSFAGIHPKPNPDYPHCSVLRGGKSVRPFWTRDDAGKYWCGWTGRFTRRQLIEMCRTTLEDLENAKLTP